MDVHSSSGTYIHGIATNFSVFMKSNFLRKTEHLGSGRLGCGGSVEC